MLAKNRQVVMRKIPEGFPSANDFEIITVEMPELGIGQMLLKTRWLTLDPYMRSGFMNVPNNRQSPIIGGTVSEVVESRSDRWRVGDLVVGYYGWQEYAVGSESDVQWSNPDMPNEKWDESLGPASTALGILGMTGYTAYQGLLNVAKVKADETVVVSAASGAVGQVVGQLAKIKRAQVIGIAGGPEKCAYCIDELGFDACIDYKGSRFVNELQQAATQGIDIYFENVGGDVLEAVIPLLNPGARVPICGFISHYNLMPTERRPTPLERLKSAGLPVLDKDGSREGFRFFSFSELAAQHPDAENALCEMSGWIKDGRLKYRESITSGFESCIPAFMGMLSGKNFGKTMVRL